MTSGFWEQVVADGLDVPADRPLDELTAELTTMLGSPDPRLRDTTAYATLAAWVGRGVYDDLLAGLGDGMAAGLAVGLGESGTDTVFRRSFSVLVVAACVERDIERQLLPPGKILEWGDRVAAWFVREQDVRGYVDGHGWAHAVAHGADAIGALGRSPALEAPELTVLLDVLADRLLLDSGALLTAGEPDRLAAAAMAILRRNLVPLSVLEPWVRRLATAAERPASSDRDPYRATFGAESFLRALHLHLVLAAERPAVRSDLLLAVVDALRKTNPRHLGGG